MFVCCWLPFPFAAASQGRAGSKKLRERRLGLTVRRAEPRGQAPSAGFAVLVFRVLGKLGQRGSSSISSSPSPPFSLPLSFLPPFLCGAGACSQDFMLNKRLSNTFTPSPSLDIFSLSSRLALNFDLPTLASPVVDFFFLKQSL